MQQAKELFIGERSRSGENQLAEASSSIFRIALVEQRYKVGLWFAVTLPRTAHIVHVSCHHRNCCDDLCGNLFDLSMEGDQNVFVAESG